MLADGADKCKQTVPQNRTSVAVFNFIPDLHRPKVFLTHLFSGLKALLVVPDGSPLTAMCLAA